MAKILLAPWRKHLHLRLEDGSATVEAKADTLKSVWLYIVEVGSSMGRECRDSADGDPILLY